MLNGVLVEPLKEELEDGGVLVSLHTAGVDGVGNLGRRRRCVRSGGSGRTEGHRDMTQGQYGVGTAKGYLKIS